MGIILKQNGNYGVRKNEVIFHEGQSTESVSILLQGKVEVLISTFEDLSSISEAEIRRKSFKLFSVNQNLFLGPNDMCKSKTYSFTYLAAEDSVLYGMNINCFEQVKVLIDGQKDYAAGMITSVYHLLNHAIDSLKKFESHIKVLKDMTENLVVYFWSLKEENGFLHTPSTKYFREGLDNLEKMKEKNYPISRSFQQEFFDKDNSEIYESEAIPLFEVNTNKVEYYKHISELPTTIQKSFFAEDIFLTKYHCSEMSDSLSDIQSCLKETFFTGGELFNRLYSFEGENIFTEYVKAANEMKRNNQDTTVILSALEYIVTKIKTIVAMYENEYNHKCEIDLDYINNVMMGIKVTAGTAIEVTDGEGTIPEELKDSALRIILYSNIPKAKADIFRANLEAFRRLKDKLAIDNDTRNIRHTITEGFFEIYEAVFKRVTEENDKTRLYQMFLQFGYMDERLLNRSQILLLYKLAGKQNESGSSQVYTVKEWLTKIYEKERDPSINDLGQEYSDVYREGRKRKDISDKEQKEIDNDINGKVKFEINNMFKVNQRVCHGQMSVYFPILHSEMVTRDLSKSIVTPEIINQAINKVLSVDFSAFHREIPFRNQEKGIEKEYIMKAILPDIILMPTFGSRASMWQEIVNRNRNSPGRLIFPIFTSENIDDLMVKIIGNFRWELCRTVMGVFWNDITLKSLTSEYTDYIQFYKKNRDLSEEGKEKVKALTLKNRGMMREIFTSEYELWINYEAKGNTRLNKIVRGIFFRNCPFTRSIRENLEKQPMYSEAAIQTKNARIKLTREIENRYNKIIKSGVELDEELIQNLKFYKDM